MVFGFGLGSVGTRNGAPTGTKAEWMKRRSPGRTREDEPISWRRRRTPRFFNLDAYKSCRSPRSFGTLIGDAVFERGGAILPGVDVVPVHHVELAAAFEARPGTGKSDGSFQAQRLGLDPDEKFYTNAGFGAIRTLRACSGKDQGRGDVPGNIKRSGHRRTCGQPEKAAGLPEGLD